MIAKQSRKLPTVIASSVVRSAYQGESHGGLYLIDLETGCFEQVVDWSDSHINWEGRGGDRGLRGIAFYKDHIYLAASNELFVYDHSFRCLSSFRNSYLNHCHETFVDGKTLYLTSTGFDSILLFDLDTAEFIQGYCVRRKQGRNQITQLNRHVKNRAHLLMTAQVNKHRVRKSSAYRMIAALLRTLQAREFTVECFDPNSASGPKAGDTLHLNSVFYENKVLYIGGTELNHLLSLRDEHLASYAWIPHGTHNVRPYKGGVLANDTAANRVAFFSREQNVIHSFPIKLFPDEFLKTSSLPADHARQGFGRGLSVAGNDVVIGGSSPATVSVYHFNEPEAIKTINLTRDVRNAIHGLEIWPF